jgi:hypothetical protein
MRPFAIDEREKFRAYIPLPFGPQSDLMHLPAQTTFVPKLPHRYMQKSCLGFHLICSTSLKLSKKNTTAPCWPIDLLGFFRLFKLRTTTFITTTADTKRTTTSMAGNSAKSKRGGKNAPEDPYATARVRAILDPEETDLVSTKLAEIQSTGAQVAIAATVEGSIERIVSVGGTPEVVGKVCCLRKT